MAKTMYSIALDFNKAKNQATKLEQAANKINRQRARLLDEKQKISRNWKSDSSDTYLRKLSVVESELADTERKLRNTATAIRTVASNTYYAEKTAITLANQRKNRI